MKSFLCRTVTLCVCALAVASTSVAALAQEQPEDKPKLIQAVAVDPAHAITLAAGTKVPLVLKAPVSTKNARPGDAIYAQTNFPVVVDDRIAIPPGTYVQGKVTEVKRAGRVKGKAELLVHFTSLIFPSGYTIMLPGSIEGVPGDEKNKVKDEEGKIQGPGSKAKDAGTVARGAETGAEVGSLAGISSGHSGRDALLGAAGGGVIGLATVLLTRGPDVRLEAGTAIEMVLERSITVDTSRASQKN